MKLKGVITKNRFRDVYKFVDNETGKSMEMFIDFVLARKLDNEFDQAANSGKLINGIYRSKCFEVTITPLAEDGEYPIRKGKKFKKNVETEE